MADQTITINRVQVKRSKIAGRRPAALADGEEFVNHADGIRLIGDGSTPASALPAYPLQPGIDDVPGLPVALDAAVQRDKNLADLSDKNAAFQTLGIPAALANNWTGTLSLREAAKRAGVTIAGNGVLTGNHITGTISGTDDGAAIRAAFVWASTRGYALDGEGLTYRVGSQIAFDGFGIARPRNMTLLVPAMLGENAPNHQPLVFGTGLSVDLGDRFEVIYVGIPTLNGSPSAVTIIRGDRCARLHTRGCKVTCHSAVGKMILTTDVYDVRHELFTPVRNGDVTLGATDFYALGSQNTLRGGKIVFRDILVKDGRGAASWIYAFNFDTVELVGVDGKDLAYSGYTTDDIANFIYVNACRRVFLVSCNIDVLVNMSNDDRLRRPGTNMLIRQSFARGIVLADCEDVYTAGCTGKLVDQPFDFSGSGKGRRTRIYGCTSWQSGAFGLKLANSQQDVTVSGFDAWFPGAAGVLVGDTPQAGPVGAKSTHLSCVRIYHPGAAKRFAATNDGGRGFNSGFYIGTNGTGGAGGISIGQGCSAYDSATAITHADPDTGGSGLPDTLTLTAPTPTNGRAAILRPRMIDGVLAVVEIVDPGLYPAGSYPSGIVPIMVGGVGSGTAPTVRGLLGGNMVYGAYNAVVYSQAQPDPITLADDFRVQGYLTAAHRGFHFSTCIAASSSDQTFNVGDNARINWTESLDPIGMHSNTTGPFFFAPIDGLYEISGSLILGSSPNNVGFKVDLYNETTNAYVDYQTLVIPAYLTKQIFRFRINLLSGQSVSLMGTLPSNGSSNAGASISMKAGSSVTFFRVGAAPLA